MSDPFAAFRKARAVRETAGNAGNKGNGGQIAHVSKDFPCSPPADDHGKQGERSGGALGCPAASGPVAHGATAAIELEDWLAFYEERAAIREFGGHLQHDAAEALAYEDAVAAFGSRPEL